MRIQSTKFILKIRKYLIYIGAIAAMAVGIINKSDICNLSLLPLVYCISMIIVKPCYENRMGMPLIIIETIKLCRYIVLPILMCQETKFKGVDIAHYNCENAVLLMCYELFCVSIVMNLICKNRHSIPDRKLLKNNFRESFGIISYIIIVYWLFIVFTEPSLRSTMFNFSSVIRDELLGNESDTRLSGIDIIFFKIGMLIIYSLFMNIIVRIKIIKKIKIWASIVVSVLLVSCLWTDGTTVSRWSMMIGIILTIYTLVYFYPTEKKKFYSGAIICFLFVIVGGSFLKTLSFGYTNYTLNDSTNMYFSSQMFDEYFQGVHSVSNCIYVAETYGNLRGFDGVLIDWFHNFPWAMKILGYKDFKIATYYYNMASGHGDLVIPTVTNCLMQFGLILSPLYSCICAYFAFFFDKKLRKSTTITVRLMYIYCVFWFSLFMAVGPNVINPGIWASVIGIWLLKFNNILRIDKKHISIKPPCGVNVQKMHIE